MLDIRYEDREILVCRKPANLAVQNASFGKKDLESMVKTYLFEKTGKPNPYLGVVHRLDQPVQGLVVFAKNRKAAAALSRQLQMGEMKKYYLAVVQGAPQKEKDVLVNYLIKDGKTNTSRVVSRETPGGKKASLAYRVLEQKEELTLLEIELMTGRHHQIRVQMAAADLPLAGDVKYNTAAESGSVISLCAWKLSFAHPSSLKRMEIFCQPSGGAFEQFF